jgi:hypothetical protein
VIPISSSSRIRFLACGRPQNVIQRPQTAGVHILKSGAETNDTLCRSWWIFDSLPIAQGYYRWRVSSPFSLSGTGRLGLVPSRTIPFSEPCHPAWAQVVAFTPHQPSFHRKFADTDASSSAKPAPTSHATTLSATREELQHRQHPTLLSIYSRIKQGEGLISPEIKLMDELQSTRSIQIVDKVALNMGISAKMSLDDCSC